MEMTNKLIRASDALRMIVNSQQDNPYSGTMAGPVWCLAHNSCISCIEVCAQVVDVKEVVHGRWLRGYPIHCSICSGPAPTDYEDCNRYDAWLTKYCPHCGAVMEGCIE